MHEAAEEESEAAFVERAGQMKAQIAAAFAHLDVAVNEGDLSLCVDLGPDKGAFQLSLSPEKRVVEMLKESKARYESAFRTSGQSFASARISATMRAFSTCFCAFSLTSLICVSRFIAAFSIAARSERRLRPAATFASLKTRWRTPPSARNG